MRQILIQKQKNKTQTHKIFYFFCDLLNRTKTQKICYFFYDLLNNISCFDDALDCCV